MRRSGKNNIKQPTQPVVDAMLEERKITITEIRKTLDNDLLQLAGLTRMYLCSIRRKTKEETHLELVNKAITIADHLVNNIGDIIHTLDYEGIQSDNLFHLLGSLVDKVEETTGMDADIEYSDVSLSLSPELTLVVYRIALEAVDNVLKHSGAGILSVRVLFSDDYFQMIIMDNGKGFDSEKFLPEDISGINNMMKRADIIGGTLNVKSCPDVGTTVRLKVPGIFR